MIPIVLNSPRIGSWLDANGAVTRSMHGEMSVFRIWNSVGSSGIDQCPPAQTAGLVLQYVFGESGDTVHDTSGNEKNGAIHNADWSDDVPPSQQCQRQGFGGFFDGDADYVQLPDLGTFDKVTIDVWLKFEDISGEHPVLMEDGWSAGAVHYQIYNDNFVLGINGVGDYKFGWQPQAGTWYFTSVQFDTGQPATDGTAGTPVLSLSVDNVKVDDASQDMGGSFTYTVGTWAGGADGAGTACPCTLPALQPTHFNAPRLGAWASADSNPNLGASATTMDRSMRGQLAVFRLWDKITNGEDRCPASGTGHLIVNYMFDSLTDVLKDRSGNNHDGVIHDTKYSADYPDLSCIFHKDQMWKMMDPIAIGEHGQVSVGCTDCQNTAGGAVAQQPPTEINLHLAFTNPIIIPGIPTEHGHDSVVIRVQNLRKYGQAAVSGANAGSIEYGDNCDGSDCGHNGRVCGTQWCFDMFLQEPECLDQWHAAEEVAWLAFESGNYISNEGLEFQVGNLPVQGGAWETARFHRPFDDGVEPVVISHVQTVNDWPYVKTRQMSSDNTGFMVSLEEVGDSNFCGGDVPPAQQQYGQQTPPGCTTQDTATYTHGLETVGWIAFVPGHGHLGVLQFEAGNTPEHVSEQPETVNFHAPFANIPRFFGSIGTHNGADASQLRQDEAGGITTTSATFYIEEEECIDQEAGNDGCNEYIAGNGCHPNAEKISWLAISPANMANAQNGGGYHTNGYQGAANTDDASVIQARHRTYPVASIGESGTATVNTGWLVVDIVGSYRSPVVFCGVPTTHGGEQSVCRIQKFRYSPPHQRVVHNAQGQVNHAEYLLR